MRAVSIESRLERVRQVMGIPEIDLADVSPDGRTAAVLSNHTGSLQLAALPLRGRAALRPLSHGTERVVFAQIAHDGRTVAFSRDFGGREDYQLFAVPLRGGTERKVTDLPPTRIFDFAWSHADDVLAFAGATREHNGLWLVNPESGAFRNIFSCRHWTFGPSFSAGDARLCASAKTTEAPTAVELVFLDGQGKGEAAIYTPKEGSENVGASWHPTEPVVLFKTDARGRYDLAAYDVDANRVAYLQAAERDLGVDFRSFDWTPDGDAVYYLAAKDGRTRLYVEPIDGSEPPRELPIPPGSHLAKMPKAGRDIVLSWSSLVQPPRVSRIRLQDRRVATVHAPRTDLPLGTVEPVVYTSFDGLPIHGWFLRPPGRRARRPCVLWIHGGPAWEVADEWNAAIQAISVAGFPVFAPNIRGSTGYGAAFEKMNIHDLGGGDLRDVEYAVRYLRTREDVDPEKIAIVGASYGGYMTFLAMTKLPDLWAAGAAAVGITDWRALHEGADAAFRSFVERYFGTPDENPELYHDRSPIHFVENVKAPLFIWHRANDSRCPLGPVAAFAERLRELGRPYEFHVMGDEGHGVQKTENVTWQYEATVAFLARRLGVPPVSGSDGPVRGSMRPRRTGTRSRAGRRTARTGRTRGARRARGS